MPWAAAPPGAKLLLKEEGAPDGTCKPAHMGGIARLVEAFEARASSSVASKLNFLIDLDQHSDPGVVPFFLLVLVDQREPTQVRVHVLKRLRNGCLTPTHRPSIAEALLQVLAERSNQALRMEATLALAEFTDIDGVPTRLGDMALDPRESIELRYSAFTSLQRAGPTSECVILLRRLLGDEMLGPSARSVLSSWHRE